MDGIHLIRPASPSTFPSEGKAVPHTIGFAVHPSLLLEEKVPNEVRRMRWSNRNGRNPPHPAGFAVHLPLPRGRQYLTRPASPPTRAFSSRRRCLTAVRRMRRRH